LHWADRVDELFPIVTIQRKYTLPCIENNREKLVVLTAFLFTTVTANQAVACDMGAIERWVAAPANGTVARQNQLLKIRLRAVTAAIVPRFIPLCDLN
jgi:hypothetical protein